MNKKQLAEMIKNLRKKKLEEIIGKPGKFNPMHHRATHEEDPTSSNQYAHGIKEARVPDVRGGAQGKATLGKLEVRSDQQRARGNQNQKDRFLGEKDDVDLGHTDTGKKGKDSEEINVNPTIKSAQGETNKNTTVKETKEK